MKNWNGTTGEWIIVNNEKTFSVETFGNDNWMIADSLTKELQDKNNFKLFVDAGNTIQKCGLLPSELLEQRDLYLKQRDDLINSYKHLLSTNFQISTLEQKLALILSNELINKITNNG